MSDPTVVHLFAGSGGCTLGFQRAGFRSLGSFDFDVKSCRDLERLTGGPAFCRDLAALQPAELRELTRGECPDVVVMSPPCKSFSGCMPAARAGEDRYVDMSQLAVRGVFLALEAWAPKLPRLVLLENVPRIQSRGAELLAQVVALLQRYGYTTDQRTHDCGVLGGLAQHRERFLLVARHLTTCTDVLRKPPPQRVRTVGEVLLPLPSPAANHGDEMHRLPLLSPLNWLRLAAIRAGKDWRDLPAAIRLGGEARRAGAYEVLDSDAPGKVVRGRHDVWAAPASTADPRLGCEPRNGHYGVLEADAPSGVILAAHGHDSGRGSVADPRLQHEPRRGTMGVVDPAAPAPTVRACHDVRQAAGAVVDERGWPVPTHELMREGDELVLYGPPIDLETRRSCYLVIRAPDGTWHRPLTDRELAVLQGFPVDCQLEGPSSSSRTGGAGRREHIGNAIPPPTAEAIAREAAATLRSTSVAGFLRGPDTWVQPEEAAHARLAWLCPHCDVLVTAEPGEDEASIKSDPACGGCRARYHGLTRKQVAALAASGSPPASPPAGWRREAHA